MAQIIKDVAKKKDETTLDDSIPLGATFNNVINDSITLFDFYNNYIAFMRETPFIYYGESTPNNPHIKIWVDTSNRAGNGL